MMTIAEEKRMVVYGPVPSRRLGQSIGINNIPPKICSYSCVYCQLGRTKRLRRQRAFFYPPEAIYVEMERKLKELAAKGEKVDYLTFVADGEPTLDQNLGATINLLKDLGIKIAVITNASLLWMDAVKKDLEQADWVSVKVDALEENTWRQINRPHGHLELNKILAGTIDFANSFKGQLVTETMLVKGLNDDEKNIEGISRQLRAIKPVIAYLLVPTRPPAESHVQRPSTERLKAIFQRIREVAQVNVECITGDEGESFFWGKDLVSDLLSITAVHPVRAEIIADLLAARKLDWSLIENLIRKGLLEEFVYEHKKFYRRKICG